MGGLLYEKIRFCQAFYEKYADFVCSYSAYLCIAYIKYLPDHRKQQRNEKLDQQLASSGYHGNRYFI